MKHFIAGAAAVDFVAMRRKTEPIKTFINGYAADDFTRRELNDNNFMLAVAGVENGGPFSGGVDGDVDGEITE